MDEYKERKNKKHIQSIKYKRLESIWPIPSDIKSKMEGVIEKEHFAEWYYSPNKALNGKAPYEIAKTRKGKKEIKNLLGRLEWGIFE